MKSTFFHVSMIVIGIVLIALTTTNFTALQMLSQQVAELEPTTGLIPYGNDGLGDEATVEDENVEEEFASLLYVKQYYDLPFGAAEIEGYLTTVKRATSLDNSTPTVTCSAFVVTDGPNVLMEALDNEHYGTPPVAVLGSEDSYFGESINNSREDAPVTVIATINPTFEGELIGCMRWPFSSIIEIE